MRLGVIGDTHDRFEAVERAVELFAAAGVEQVVHTGDITRPSTLEGFAALTAPMVVVYGNNDFERRELGSAGARLGFTMRGERAELELAGVRVLVVHDPADVGAPDLGGVDLFLHGHTHRHREERIGSTLAFNPGECAAWMAGRNAVGVVDLVTLRTELLRF